MALSSSRQASPLRVATGGDASWRLEASSPPLACLLLESLGASSGNQWSDAGGLNHTVIQ